MGTQTSGLWLLPVRSPGGQPNFNHQDSDLNNPRGIFRGVSSNSVFSEHMHPLLVQHHHVFYLFFVQQKILLSKVGNKTVKSHRRNGHAWMIKVNWWTLAHLHAGLAVGLLDTFFLLSSEMRYPLCWCVFAQGKIGERCKYKYDHGIQMNYFSFNLYNVYRNYLDWQQLDLTAIIFIIRNIGQP